MTWLIAGGFFLLLVVSSVSAFVPTKSSSTWGLSDSLTERVAVTTTAPTRQFAIGNHHQDWNRFVALHMSTSNLSTEEKNPVKLIIAGAPASGKGTQCSQITERYGVVHLSTGDMLRAAVAAGTDVGRLAKEYMDNGKLVPDDVIIGIVKDRLEEEDCMTNGWLLDGFPRTKAQADALAGAGITADCFIFLNVPDAILVERVVGRRTDPVTGTIYHMKFSPPPADDTELLGRLVHRSDDTEEKVKVRLEQFHANVDAVKGSYADISISIDGNQAPSDVSEDIRVGIASMIEKQAS